MRTGIEQCRLDLAKWDARVAEDKAALASAERYAEHLRERLAGSVNAAKSLRDVVQRWEAMVDGKSTGRTD